MIERRFEVPPTQNDPDYAGRRFEPENVARGDHRQHVGGRWDVLGQLQRDFLIAQGLQAHHRFIDIGCGSLRAGRYLVDELEPGNYYGIDINAELIQAGYDHELTDAQRDRLPETNLRATDRFDADFGVTFDYAIAQSLFTHISLNMARLCLERVSRCMSPGGRLFVTFYEVPATKPLDHQPRKQFSERNPFWYYRRDMRWLGQWGGWSFRYLGKWQHPTGQRMVEYRAPG